MQIGNVKDFMQQQSGKAKMRQEEEKKIKKAVYQMKTLIEAQSEETLMKECDKAEAKRSGEGKDTKDTGTKSKENKKTDAQTEMEKMLSATRRGIALNNAVN